MADLITSRVVVIDNGSGSLKCGYSGGEVPEKVIPCLIGRHKFLKTAISSDSGTGEELLGEDARNARGILQLRHPISHGHIKHWPDMEKLWALCYSELGITKTEENPVHLTEPPLNPRATREKTASIFFEQFGTPALYMSIQAVLSLYAAGRSTGLALDCGEGVCHSVPMIEGFMIPYALERSDLGGFDVDFLLKRLLRRSGYTFNTSAELEIVRDIKETTCSINPKTQRNVAEAVRDMNKGGSLHVGSKFYTLPDKTVIEISAEREWAPECLFHPILAGKEDLGVHELVQVAISRAPVDNRTSLWNSIILSGGSTLFPSFPARMLAELRRFTSKETKMRISASPNRHHSAYVGGSILASLSSFKKLWVTKREYDEIGPHVLARKLGE